MSAPSCGGSKSRERNGILTRLYGGSGSWICSSESGERSEKTVSSGQRDEGRRKAANPMPSRRQPMPAGLMATSDPSFQFCAHDSPVPHRRRKRSPHDQSNVTLQEFSSLRLRLRVAVGSSEPCRFANRSPSSSHGWSREGGGPPSGHQGSHLGVIASLEKAGRQGRRGSQHHLAGVRVALARISRHRDRVAPQQVKGNKRDAVNGY